ncbi:hypothetical protein [Serratia ureilytica]|uniref:hypothetical protein n=1 Tax=Serratia ureilytica TaxID=300181 RepID=UPI001D191EE7|nr:hypothetical protein [Serratia ureilytica]MCC4104760.1 hypothetical protein [Serratia ureilytica]
MVELFFSVLFDIDPELCRKFRLFFKSTKGMPHFNVSQVQNNSVGGGLLGSETVIAFKALRAAGLGPQEAKCATLKARGYLTGIGANAGTTTIPKKGGNDDY